MTQTPIGDVPIDRNPVPIVPTALCVLCPLRPLPVGVGGLTCRDPRNLSPADALICVHLRRWALAFPITAIAGPPASPGPHHARFSRNGWKPAVGLLGWDYGDYARLRRSKTLLIANYYLLNQ
jgi:hypothetical protein